jgi:hypothetical protein
MIYNYLELNLIMKELRKIIKQVDMLRKFSIFKVRINKLKINYIKLKKLLMLKMFKLLI